MDVSTIEDYIMTNIFKLQLNINLTCNAQCELLINDIVKFKKDITESMKACFIDFVHSGEKNYYLSIDNSYVKIYVNHGQVMLDVSGDFFVDIKIDEDCYLIRNNEYCIKLDREYKVYVHYKEEKDLIKLEFV